MSTKKRYYLAGPMTGIPQFNFPLFDRAATALRARGIDVVSPAELDRPETREAALKSPDGNPEHYGTDVKETWGDFLARDVKIVADEVDGLVLLPGWDRSLGARLEAYVGLLGNKEFFEIDDTMALVGLHPYEVAFAIANATYDMVDARAARRGYNG